MVALDAPVTLSWKRWANDVLQISRVEVFSFKALRLIVKASAASMKAMEASSEIDKPTLKMTRAPMTGPRVLAMPLKVASRPLILGMLSAVKRNGIKANMISREY